MCLVAPARVIAVDGDEAVVDLDGRRRRASLLLEPGVRVGDWVIVGSGTVLRRLASAEAESLLETLRAHGTTAATTPTGGPR